MSTDHLSSENCSPAEWAPSKKQEERSPWRKRLAETERGFTACFRANSSMFLYFFSLCILLCIAIVLGLQPIEWGILTLSISIVLFSESAYFSIHGIIEESKQQISAQMIHYLKMAQASLMILLAGSILSIGILLGSKLYELYWH